MRFSFRRFTRLRQLWSMDPRPAVLLREWRSQARLARSDASLRAATLCRLVVLPSYPPDVFGSKGDEAMITAALDVLAHHRPNLNIGIFLSPDSTRYHRLQERGCQLLHLDGLHLDAVTAGFDAFEADGCLVIGADVMDGYYNLAASLFSLAVADVAARRGMKSVISGFSFNARPHPRLRPAFDQLDPHVSVNVRDPVSLRRFRSFCHAPARLVADMAFLLQPDLPSPRVTAAATWARRRREVGDVVLGINVHPALFTEATVDRTRWIAASMATALTGLLRRNAASIVLMSHDYRSEAAPCDDDCLAEIHESLRSEFGERICRPTERMTAAELKAIAGSMDGVVTGRMHLAIASLGMGVPVAGITYQDKFEGLFELFGLPATFLTSPAAFRRPATLLELMERFLAERATLRAQVKDALPNVLLSAAANLDALLDTTSSRCHDGNSHA